MVINNLIYFSLWWVFFHQFQNVRGWNFQDMTLLIMITFGSYGLSKLCFGGVRNISLAIQNGDLDLYLIQPKNVLLHILGSKSFVSAWGSLLTSLILFFMSGISSLTTIFLLLLSIVTGCVIFTSFCIIAHSLPFWLGSVEGLSKKYCDALYLFMIYPSNIYSGMMQVVMFTLIPAGLISSLPVNLIRQFSWGSLFIMMGSAVAFCLLAHVIFYRGLKRYESGNRIGISR